MAKLIVVCGATGQLGGSVARRMLQEGWTVRAITRNAGSEAAKALADQGAELATANFDDEASLVKVFEGATAIFGVTNFWDYILELGAEGAGQRETEQMLRIASAAGKTTTLEHFILHSLASGEKLAGEEFAVPHWDYKNKAQEEIKKSMPELAAKTTFVWVGYFASNLFALLKPIEVPGSYGGHVIIQPCSPSTIMWVTEIENNVGVFVSAVLAKPDVSLPAKVCNVTTDVLPYGDVFKMLGEITGKRVQYVACTPEEYEGIYGVFGAELARQFKCNEAESDWGKANPGELVGAKELGIPEGKLVGLRQALERDKGKM